jgi:hypothetical protein
MISLLAADAPVSPQIAGLLFGRRLETEDLGAVGLEDHGHQVQHKALLPLPEPPMTATRSLGPALSSSTAKRQPTPLGRVF